MDTLETHNDARRPVAWVIGGSRGIGRACVSRLAAAGFDITLTCRGNMVAAEEAKREVEAAGRACKVVAFDIADRAASTAALESLLKTECPDALVYNAGIARDTVFAMMTPEEWDTVLGTNLTGFYNVLRPVVFEMLRRKRGRIVVISSISGQVGQAGQVNYSASKAGLIGAARALAREVGRKNIFVNVVAPGVIETDMTAELPKERILPLIPLNRFGTVEEVASVVTFLCAEPHMYVHGQVIGVNGGMSI